MDSRLLSIAVAQINSIMAHYDKLMTAYAKHHALLQFKLRTSTSIDTNLDAEIKAVRTENKANN